MEKKAKRGGRNLVIAILICVMVWWCSYRAYGMLGPRTCGASDEDLHVFLEEHQQREVDLLKVEEGGRIKAAIYDRDDLGTCVAIFERKLLGLRWEYTGMDMLVENGLQAEGSWLRVGMNDSKCEVVVCGDNRSGDVGSYVLRDAEEVARSGLEADYIIDIYILDGISELPDDFRQYKPDGSVFERER